MPEDKLLPLDDRTLVELMLSRHEETGLARELIITADYSPPEDPWRGRPPMCGDGYCVHADPNYDPGAYDTDPDVVTEYAGPSLSGRYRRVGLGLYFFLVSAPLREDFDRWCERFEREAGSGRLDEAAFWAEGEALVERLQAELDTRCRVRLERVAAPTESTRR